MKQTAVEQLVQEIKLNSKFKENSKGGISFKIGLSKIDELLKQAKAMEEEQIKDAHFTSSGCNSFDMPTDRINSAYKAAQQYYNETFKSE